MPAALLFVIFVVLLVIAIPVSITLGIASVLPSVFDPSFTVGAKYLIRAMFGGLDSFPLLAVPMFVLSGIIMAKGGISKKLFDIFAFFLGNFYRRYAMRGHRNLPLLRRYLRLCPGNRRSRRKHDDPDFKRPRL